MAANENIIRKAAGARINDREQEAMLDIRFYIAIAATLVALLLIAFSSLH